MRFRIPFLALILVRIAAGASDYIPKPVDTEQLLSLLRVWLYK